MIADRSEYVSAVHESAHAVMALDMGVNVFEVSILPDHDSSAHCTHVGMSPEYGILNYGITIAGPFAQAWVCNDSSFCGSDFDRAEEIINELIECGEWPLDAAEVLSRVQVMENYYQNRVERLRPKIENLANELMARKTMTGDEIKELLNWPNEEPAERVTRLGDEIKGSLQDENGQDEQAG